MNKLMAHGLWHQFGQGAGAVIALDGVDIQLERGTFTLLRGPSGSGKSTLLAAVSGLMRAMRGEVLLDGHPIWGGNGHDSSKFRAQHCGFVFQGSGLLPGLSAIDQVSLPIKLLGVPPRVAAERAAVALDRVGLMDRRHARPHEMSGGQNQRVAFARVLAKEPEFVFCDEPTSALDRRNGQVVGALLRDMVDRSGSAVLCMTHDERLLPFADLILTMEDGRIIESVAASRGSV